MTKRVRIGIVGTSWWVDLMYLPSLSSHPDAEVVAICGRNKERAGEVAASFGGAEVFTDYRAMIGSGKLDAVIVATPDDLHCEIVLMAIDVGLHVLCEKPLAGNAAQAREMQRRAEAAGIIHMVLFTWRWQPHWRYARHLIDTGHIGTCRYASFEFLASFALDPGYKWRFDGRRANGVTGDLGSHMIDFAGWYLGEIRRVSADLPVFVDQSGTAEPAPQPANDAGFLTLEHASGARSQINVSAVSWLGDEGVRVSASFRGDAGSLEIRHTYFGENAGATIRVVQQGTGPFQLLAVPPEFLEGGVESGQIFDPYLKQPVGARLFVDAILAKQQPVPGFEVGVAVQEVVDAAMRSHNERRWVSLAGA